MKFENRAWGGLRLIDIGTQNYEITFHTSYKKFEVTKFQQDNNGQWTGKETFFQDWNKLKQMFPNTNISEFDETAKIITNEIILDAI